MKFKKLLFLAVFIASCSPSKPIPPNTLVIGIESGPKLLDPRFATDAISSKITSLIYPGLFKRNKNLGLVPNLAASVELIDEKTYLIKLKEGVKFHNGKELTAMDVLYTYQSIISPDSKSPKRSALEKIDKIEINRKYSLTIKLKEPHAPFIANLTIGIIPAGSKELTKKPIGAGPFRFVSYKRGSMLALKKNENYFGGAPKLDGLIFKILPDETVRLLELKKGNVHLVSNPITPSVIPWLEKQASLKIEKEKGTNVSYIGFNMNDPVLKNLKVRKAIAHAVNRHAIAKHIMKNLVSETESLITPSNKYFNGKLKKLKYDPALSRKLLDEAGYPKKADGEPRFKLVYKTSKNPTRKKIAEIFGEQLRQVGIELEIKSFEWGTFFSDIKSGNFQLYSLTWVGIADPDIYHYIFHSKSVPPDGANRGHYKNYLVDQLLESGRREMDPRKRKIIYDEVQSIIAEDFPYVHLWLSVNVAAMSRQVKGFEIYPDESLDSLKRVTLEGGR